MKCHIQPTILEDGFLNCNLMSTLSSLINNSQYGIKVITRISSLPQSCQGVRGPPASESLKTINMHHQAPSHITSTRPSEGNSGDPIFSMRHPSHELLQKRRKSSGVSAMLPIFLLAFCELNVCICTFVCFLQFTVKQEMFESIPLGEKACG